MNLFTDRIKAKKSTPNMQDSLIIGTLQAFAIIPGISRSGSTIFAGVTRGVDRKQAADFSFLLSVPAVLGASVLQVVKYGGSAQIYPVSYFAGFVTAFIFGFLSIKIVIEVLLTKNFKWFGVYCVAVGILTLVFL
jgi:undecaprenyl-diphosphatase